jgi:prepilin-type N-terminal cleavage/methylation domain-containing protein
MKKNSGLKRSFVSGRFKKKAGFTLFEILVVVAILGVLAGIAIFNFEGILNRGDIARAKGELGALQAALESYYVHHDSAYPAALSDLSTAVPNIIGTALPEDVFNEGSDYGYDVSANGYYYVVYSAGIDGTGSAAAQDDGSVSETAGDICIFVSNSTKDTEP